MNYWKKMAFVLALVAGLCRGASAQNWGHGDGDHDRDDHRWRDRDHDGDHDRDRDRDRWRHRHRRGDGDHDSDDGYYHNRTWRYGPNGDYGYYPNGSYACTLAAMTGGLIVATERATTKPTNMAIRPIAADSWPATTRALGGGGNRLKMVFSTATPVHDN